MKNRQKRISLTILSGIALLTLSGISSSYAQGTVDFAGTWNTVTSKGKKMQITLSSVRRSTVSGTYARNGLSASYQTPDDRSGGVFVKVSMRQSASSITGTVTGNVLRFKWSEDGGRGSGKFTMSADGQSFEGTFSKTDNPDDTSGGTWNGTRAPSFNGVWQTSPWPQLLFQQSGNQVTGHLFAGNPNMGMIRDGVIEGMTLRFTVWRSSSPIRPVFDQYMGAGELVMEKGSKSFKGNILGAPITGTRLGR